MNEEIKKFIEENINLIEENRWEEIYSKAFPTGFTDALLEAQINPAELLGYIPKRYLENSKINQYSIPNKVTNIGYAAFLNCSSLTSVIIGDSVTSIGTYAFTNCSSLISIQIPANIRWIAEWVFAYCTSLTSLKYAGTKEQWKKINKGRNWRKYSAIKKIICTDGIIEV